MNLSVFGLGKLGSPLAAVMASKGYNVVGVDINQKFVDEINAGRAPVAETRLQEFIDKSKSRLRATMDAEEAVLNSDFSFVIVPTPSDEAGRFSMKFALITAETIGKALKKKDSFHVVVMTSTVMPGDTEGEFIPALEKHSGKKCGVDFGVCYNPEFIALGSVVQDMLTPDFILIGEGEERSGKALAEIYQNSCDNDPIVARMNYVNAELTKISVNTFVTTKISYANMLAQICEQLPGADAVVVGNAIGCDSRIGKKYLRGAVSYGGPCFPRDNIAFSVMARDLGVKPLIAEATDQMNAQQNANLVAMAARNCPDMGTIGVLGLSYKPNTSVVEKSAGVAVANGLIEKGFVVNVFDPAAMGTSETLLDAKVKRSAGIEDCVQLADVILIATAWDEFKLLPSIQLKQGGSRPVVIDCWHMMEHTELSDQADMLFVGRGPSKR